MKMIDDIIRQYETAAWNYLALDKELPVHHIKFFYEMTSDRIQCVIEMENKKRYLHPHFADLQQIRAGNAAAGEYMRGFQEKLDSTLNGTPLRNMTMPERGDFTLDEISEAEKLIDDLSCNRS